MTRTTESALRWLAGDETQPLPRVMHGMGHMVETVKVMREMGR